MAALRPGRLWSLVDRHGTGDGAALAGPGGLHHRPGRAHLDALGPIPAACEMPGALAPGPSAPGRLCDDGADRRHDARSTADQSSVNLVDGPGGRRGQRRRSGAADVETPRARPPRRRRRCWRFPTGRVRATAAPPRPCSTSRSCRRPKRGDQPGRRPASKPAGSARGTGRRRRHGRAIAASATAPSRPTAAQAHGQTVIARALTQPDGGDGRARRVPEVYRLRMAPNHARLAQGRGGSPETEAAVQAALQWLAENQSADGHWSARQHEAGRETAGRRPRSPPRRRRGRHRHDRPGPVGVSGRRSNASRRPAHRGGPPRTGIPAVRAGGRRQSGGRRPTCSPACTATPWPPSP